MSSFTSSPIRDRLFRPATMLAGGWLAPIALLALCLLPRAIMAWKVPGICPDAALYIHLGKAFEAGMLEDSLGDIRFNIYPLILAGLHAYGLAWETAGVAWSVVISSCTVLPLYGWIHRAFDRRTALAAGFLYAVHPGLVRWSVEIIRDSTFWFLLAASIYLLWRAMTELRWRWFVAAGITIAFSCLTRFEGMTLYLLLAAWLLWRSKQGARSREQGGLKIENCKTKIEDLQFSICNLQSRPFSAFRAAWPPAPRSLLLASGLICVGMYPLTLMAVNQLWYHGTVRGLVRTQPAELACDWAQESVKGRSEAKKLARPDLLPPLPVWKMAERFVTGFFKGLSPLYLLTLLLGIARKKGTVPICRNGPKGASHKWGLSPFFGRGDYRALALVAGPVLFAIWVHLYWSHEAGPRYFFPIVMLAAPLAGCGLWRLEALLGLLVKAPGRLAIRPTLALTALFVLANMFIAFSGDMRSRAAAMEVGQWLGQRYGPATRIFGPDGITQVAAHYAHARCRSFPQRATAAAVVRQVNRWRPVVVLLDADGPASPRDEISRRMAKLGFVPIDEMPRVGGWILVMARAENARLWEKTDPVPVVNDENCKMKIANCKLRI